MNPNNLFKIHEEFFIQNSSFLASGAKEGGLHDHIKQERASWAFKAIEFTLKAMDRSNND